MTERPAYAKLTEDGIIYVPPGLPKEDYTYAVEEGSTEDTDHNYRDLKTREEHICD